MQKYKHLFFDLDHTLWDFDTNAKLTLEDIFSTYQLHETIKVDFDAFYKKYLHHNKLLWERYQNGYITAEELKWKRMWRTLMDFKVANEALSKQLSVSFLEILPTKTTVFPYTNEILHYLHNKSYKMHLITNGFAKTQKSKIKNSNIDHFFTHIITSEESNSMKPEKEIFDFAINVSSAKLEESIMIGDNPDADIKGALNYGMDCIFVQHVDTECTFSPTHTITHLQQLESIL
jgi:putative hydrolase of the HAD superfamily